MIFEKIDIRGQDTDVFRNPHFWIDGRSFGES